MHAKNSKERCLTIILALNLYFVSHSILFPLNRCRRFTGELVDDAADTRYFGGDSVGDMAEERPREFNGAGDHEVIGFDGAKRNGVVVGPGAVFDANGGEPGHYGKIL